MTSLVHKAPHLARYLLGTIFLVFGLNFFLHFIPQPPMEGPAADFATALFASGFVFPVLKGAEVVAGAFLLGNRFVPLALALLAPAVVGIVGFHTVLAPAGMPMALLVLVLELYLAWSYRNAFAPMLRVHTEPARSETYVTARSAA